MKIIRTLVSTLLILWMLCGFQYADNSKITYTDVEQQFIQENRQKTFKVGLDPLSGMDYFVTEDGQILGLVVEVLQLIERDIGFHFEVEASKEWNAIYEGLQTGEVDVLFGANETPERQAIMSFTAPLYQHPYAIFTLQATDMFTIGDLDNNNVGFVEGDFVAEALKEKYIYLNYTPVYYGNQEDVIRGLKSGEIEAAVFSGGSITYKFLYEHPEMKYVAPIESIVSDLTFSVQKNNEVLWSILNKQINYLKVTGELNKKIHEAEVAFIRKIIHLTPEERKWLEEDGVVHVGITEDYLPIDYYNNQEYLGVSGAVFSEIAHITGMNPVWVYDDFNALHQQLVEGGVDILNIVRTDERSTYLNFTNPYSYERDIIVGLKTADEVLDIYGLENKRVAVVDGFWHEEYLKKNLVSVEFVKTNDIVDSMRTVLEGEADYFIENPTVVKFYIAVNEYYDLVEKGVTSSDSYLYYGVTKRQPALHGIINKVLPIIDINSLQKEGYQSVPLVTKKRTESRLIIIIFALIAALSLIGLRFKRVLRELISERATTEVYKQRQILEYTDVMTSLKNRNYFYKEVEPDETESKQPLGVLMCDIDRLKYVNDNYGHPVGDQLIIEVAKILEKVVGHISMPIRMGGDEFLVLLPHHDDHMCKTIVTVIEEEIAAVQIKASDTVEIDIALSLGYAVQLSSDETLEHVIMRADNEMYMNKRRRWSM